MMPTPARSFLIAALALTLDAPGLAAQTAPPIDVGARIRIDATTGRAEGTLARLTSDSLWISDLETGHSMPFALRDVPEVEVWAGRQRSFFRSAGKGVVAGFLAGAVLGALTYEGPDLFVDSRSGAAMMAGVVVSIPGAVIGGLYGLVPRDRWQRSPLPAPVAAPEPPDTAP